MRISIGWIRRNTNAGNAYYYAYEDPPQNILMAVPTDKITIDLSLRHTSPFYSPYTGGVDGVSSFNT